MLVTVWRHGEAGSAATDAQRSLTARGQSTLLLAVTDFRDWQRAQKLAPVSYCLSSPLVRTMQTARLLGDTLDVEPVVCDGLALEADLNKPESFLRDSESHLLLVSHQPFVSQLIWHWLDGDDVDPLLPGGWATMDVVDPSRGGATLIKARESIFEA